MGNRTGQRAPALCPVPGPPGQAPGRPPPRAESTAWAPGSCAGQRAGDDVGRGGGANRTTRTQRSHAEASHLAHHQPLSPSVSVRQEGQEGGRGTWRPEAESLGRPLPAQPCSPVALARSSASVPQWLSCEAAEGSPEMCPDEGKQACEVLARGRSPHTRESPGLSRPAPPPRLWAQLRGDRW